MTAIIFYDWALDSRCYAVRLALSVMDVRHTSIAINMEQDPAKLASLFRNGRRPPALIRADTTLFSASAILLELAQGTSPASPWHISTPDAALLDWLGFAERALEIFCTARDAALGAALPGGPDVSALRMVLRVMEDHMTLRHLRSEPWFCSESAGIVDLAVFPVFALSPDLAIEHDGYPALRSWMRRTRMLPGFLTVPGVPDYY